MLTNPIFKDPDKALHRWQPMRVIPRPITSSGPDGVVVEATRITVGFARNRCWRLRATCGGTLGAI
jgi:hypothetical protein